ncbi:MAG: ABC transporter substrate-binding protein [Planctomycetota bacterium]
MFDTLKRLSLGVSLILLASVVLLLSDAPRRTKLIREPDSQAGQPPRSTVMKVAMMQMASQPIIDEGAAGVLAGLKEAGFVEGTSLKLSRFNAEGDLATANAMAQELTGGGYDLVITLTTSALQAVANANQQRRVPHVFGLVTDPTQAGVGVGTEPLDHPSHMVGIGTLQPVAESLRMARQLNPKLARVGIAWNPAEVNSEICTKLAREACGELKLELLEATVENTAAVSEAIASLIARDVDVLWIGGDVSVLAAFEVVANAAKNAHIPVCTCMPGNAAKGSLFDVGANYYEVGRNIGRLAGRVLSGDEIAKLPVERATPPKLMVNKLALNGPRDAWSFPTEILAKADSVIDDQGQHDKPRREATASPAPLHGLPAASAPLSKVWQLRLLAYINSPDVEEAEQGLRDGLKKAGVIEGRDYELKAANSQGDMTSLHGMVEAALADRADLLLTISTQALQSAVQRARGTPIVFTMVANPFAAGVATTEAEHLANVTGAYGSNDVDSMLPIIQQLMPDARRVGAMFAPTEVNSVYSHELLVKAARGANYELISLGVNSPSEAPDVTQSLCGQQIDLICLPNSNLAGSSFPTIVQSAKKAKVPVFGFLGSMASQGAVVVLTRDYHDMGVDSGLIAARVMRGEKPAALPLHQSRKNRLLLNTTAAKAAGLTFPDDLLKSADRVIE